MFPVLPMKSSMRKRLDRQIWQERARVALPFALLLVALTALFSGLYAFIYAPDPVVESRKLRGAVTYWTRQQTDLGAGALIMRLSLDDGRDITLRRPPVDFPRYDRAEVEEQRHKSGRISFRWVRWIEPRSMVRP
jgi:hypothetical protein